MNDTTPEPTREETIARLAAEAAVAALPDYGAKIAALESEVRELAAAMADLDTAPRADLAELSQRLDALADAVANPDTSAVKEALADAVAEVKLHTLNMERMASANA